MGGEPRGEQATRRAGTVEEVRGGVSGTSTGVGAAVSRGDKCGEGREEKSRLRGGPSGGAGERGTATCGGDAGCRPREG